MYNGEPLEFNNKGKYLGVTLDNKLTWRQHIENTKNKMNKGKGILKKCITYFLKRSVDYVWQSNLGRYCKYSSFKTRANS